MNYKKLIILVVLLIIPIGYFAYQSFISTEYSENKNDLTIDDDFNKKIMCSERKSDIKLELDKIADNAKLVRKIELKEIFYSKKLNSCLYVYENYDYSKNHEPFAITLKDALTDKIIDSEFFISYYNQDGSRNEKIWNELDQFRSKIESYK